MKTLLLFLTAIILVSCGQPQRRADSRSDASLPKPAQLTANQELKILDRFRIQAGWLYVYEFGADTVYIIEGLSSTAPVSIHVK